VTDIEWARDAVFQGAEYLDGVRPGWEREIDLDTLDVSLADLCVLGQLYLSFKNAVITLDFSVDELVSCGFVVVGTWPVRDRYRQLNIAWAELIRERLDLVA
jgi:hypothetical protein